MSEIATQNDILTMYKNAGGGNATVQHPTECVTKGEVLSAPNEQTLGFRVGVSATDYKDNELCAVTEVSITKTNRTVYISWDDESQNGGCSNFQVGMSYGNWSKEFQSGQSYDSWNVDVPNDTDIITLFLIDVTVKNTGWYDNSFYFSYQVGTTEHMIEESYIPTGSMHTFHAKSTMYWSLYEGTHIFFRIRELNA